MIKLKIILIVLITCFISFEASARPRSILEPYAGLALKATFSDGKDEFDLFGGVAGGRLGFFENGFSVGVDGKMGTLTTETGATDIKHTYSQLSGFLGYNIPDMFRVWAAYAFTATFQNAETENKFLDPSGYSVGIGYMFESFMGLNLEYNSASFKKVKIKSSGAEREGDYTLNYILLSLSFPFVL